MLEEVNSLSDKTLVFIIKALDVGGAEKFTYNLSRHLSSYFKKVYIISSGGFFVEELERAGIKHIKFPSYLFKKNFFPLLLLNLWWVLRKIKFDIVHCQHRLPQLALQLIKPKAPLLYTANNKFNDYYQRLLRPIMAASVSPLIEKNLLNTTSILPANIININYGVRLHPPSKHRNKSERFQLLFLGRIIKIKGIYEVIDALIKMDEKYRSIIKLRICGEGKDLDSIELLVSENRLKDLVEFLPKTVDENLIFDGIDLLILPTRLNEGLPISILEAAGRGIPSLTTDAGGILDFLIDGYNGFILKNITSEMIAERIKYIMSIPVDDYTRIRENAFNSVSSGYNINDMLENYRDLYCRLLTR